MKVNSWREVCIGCGLFCCCDGHFDWPFEIVDGSGKPCGVQTFTPGSVLAHGDKDYLGRFRPSCKLELVICPIMHEDIMGKLEAERFTTKRQAPSLLHCITPLLKICNFCRTYHFSGTEEVAFEIKEKFEPIGCILSLCGWWCNSTRHYEITKPGKDLPESQVLSVMPLVTHTVSLC